MSGCDKRSKIVSCYEMKFGINSSEPEPCPCPKKQDSNIQKEAKEELEKAKRLLKTTESSARQNRNSGRSCHDQVGKSVKKPASRPCVSTSPCKQNEVPGSREAIKRLARMAGKECEGADGKYKGKRDIPPTILKLTAACKPGNSTKEGKELPKKPVLTSEQLSELIEQEAKDVESAWVLTSESRETYKKPCPKQQKARDAIKALIDPPKKEEPGSCLVPIIVKEPLPLIDPDPEDISPEVAANMMYTQERGIKMISCPEETIRHLFPQQFATEEKEKEKEKEKPAEKTKGDEEESEAAADEDAEEVDDSVFTRNMSQQKEMGDEDRTSSKYYDGTGKSYDKKREFLLQEKASKCVNKVQLRGNFAQWFPGYFVAFPDQGDQGIQLVKSPSSVFQRAWMVSQPNNVPETDLYLIE